MMKIVDYLNNKNIKYKIKSNLENWNDIGSSASIFSCLKANFLVKQYY